jgi:hypothetical protein
MDHDGLTNRYDHVIMAGAALGAMGGGPAKLKHWHETFIDHLSAAYKLHHIKDVYILEHRDCGAYREFLKAPGTFDDDEDEKEAECHRTYANMLHKVIEDWATKKRTKLHVKAFLMDLRGRVSLLAPP